MSGGVDSSVAAYLMLQRGYDCTGVTLRLFDGPQEAADEKTCCSLDSTEDARSVCRRLGIPFFVYNFTDSFENAVIKRFVSAYENGSTPNPCIDCNRYIKFDKLMRHAEALGFDCVVTGHYATIAYDAASGRYLLKKSVDTGKDQSYVLYPLTQAQLAKTVFPLGEMTKEQTRAIAEEQGFVNAHKHDSQDICMRAAMCSDGTRASSATPSVSARAWAWRCRTRCMSKKKISPPTRSCSATTRRCSAASCSQAT